MGKDVRTGRRIRAFLFFGAAKVALSCALLCGVFLCPAKVALAQERPAQTIRDLKVSDLFVPGELGVVSQIQPAVASHAAAKQVILIQDAHVNYEAQKHLAAIVDRLASTYGVRLILVEGGEGDVSLSYMRDRGSPAARQAVGEEYLKTGMISGEEYLDIVSEQPLMLWGIDDPARYREHFNLFLEVERVAASVSQELEQLRQLAQTLKERTVGEALKAFEATQAQFDADQLPLEEYAKFLIGHAAAAGLSLADAPNVERVVAVTSIEATVNFEQAHAEQSQVIAKLRTVGSAEELAHLTDTAQQLHTDQAATETFYQELSSLITRHQIDLSGMPNLAGYLRYIRLKTELEPRALLSELTLVVSAIKARLAASASEKELTELADRVGLIQRLLQLAWTPDDYTVYQAHAEECLPSQWLPQLRTHAEQLGVAWTGPNDPAALDAAVARGVQFYAVAKARDLEMVRRALEAMDAKGERTAALIAGGFHTDDMRDLLMAQGIDVAVITPDASDEDDHDRYSRILKFKYGARR